MTPMLRQAYAEAALRSRRLGHVEVPGRVPGDKGGTAMPSSEPSDRMKAAADLRSCILAKLTVKPSLAVELIDALGSTSSKVHCAIKALRSRGLINFSPETKSTKTGGVTCNRYSLADAGRAFAADPQTRAAQREGAVLAPVAAPAPENAPAGKSDSFGHGVLSHHPMSNEAKVARVSLRPWPHQEVPE